LAQRLRAGTQRSSGLGMAARGGSVSGAAGELTARDQRGVAIAERGAPGRRAGRSSGKRHGTCFGARVPSKLMAGERPTATPSKAMLAISLISHSTPFSAVRAGMGHGAVARSSTCWAYFHKYPESYFGWRGFQPSPAHRAQPAELDLERALLGIDGDDVAVAQSAIGPPTAASGPTWPTQKAAGRPEKPAVGDQARLAAHALPIKGSGGRQHLAHPGPPLGPSYRITSTSPSLYFLFFTASKHASSPSKQRAGR
jgi:hypothetical protein